MIFNKSGTGLFYSEEKNEGQRLCMPVPHCGNFPMIRDDMFFWKIDCDTLNIIYSKHNLYKFNIVSITDKRMSLINSRNDTIKYDCAEEITPK